MRGTSSRNSNTELFTPLWVSVAQLAFAAVLLYAIRNPAPIQQLETRLQNEPNQAAAITVTLPASNVAVAATSQRLAAKQSM